MAKKVMASVLVLLLILLSGCSRPENSPALPDISDVRIDENMSRQTALNYDNAMGKVSFEQKDNGVRESVKVSPFDTKDATLTLKDESGRIWSLLLPAGCVPYNAEISMELLYGIKGETELCTPAAGVYFHPSGLEFEKPAILTVSAGNTTSAICSAAYDGSGMKLAIPATIEKNSASNSVYLMHFSTAFGVTINKILKDKRYLGYFEYGKTKPVRVGSKKRIYLPKEEWITIPNHHEAIISQELFDRVQMKISSKLEKKCPKTEQEPSALSGKLHCAVCKRALASKRLKSGTFYFCKTKNQLSECKCYKGRITESELETKLLSVIEAITKASDISLYLSRNEQKENILEKQKQLKGIQTVIDKQMLFKVSAYEKYIDGIIDKADFLTIRENIDAEVERLKQEIQKNEFEIQSAHQILLSKESDVQEAFIEQSQCSTLKKELLDVLIDTIYLNEDGSVNIQWSFGDLFDTDAIQKEYEVSA